MFRGCNITICMTCGKRIHQEPGFCILCGEPVIRQTLAEIQPEPDNRPVEIAAGRPSWDGLLAA